MFGRIGFVMLIVFPLTMVSCAVNPGGTTGLTDAQARAVDAAVNGVGTLGKALAAVEPSSDATTDTTSAQTFPNCPEVDLQLSDGAFTVTLDYGESCSPLLFPDAVFSGVVSGSLSVAQGQFTIGYEFDAFTIDDQSLDGFIEGSIARSGDIVTLGLEADLTASEGNNIVADLSADVNKSNGLITIDDSTATMTEAAVGTVDVVYEGIIIDYPNHGNFIPEAGTATFVLPNDGPGPDTVTIIVEFTEETPATRTVLVTVGESGPIEHTIGED